MKYLITNPDSFGDAVLRQPLFKGLLDAGHEVGVLVKRSYSQIFHFLDPRLHLFMTEDLNPYVISILHDRPKVEEVFDQIDKFNPDVLVIAPYQRTLIDLWTMERFSGIRTIGMQGLDVVFENGRRIIRPTTRPGDVVLFAPEDLSEVEKNRRLLSLCLGKSVQEYSPQLTLPPATLQLARGTLDQLQLKPRSYIICTPGSTSLSIKQYPIDRFTRVLAFWAQTYKRDILLASNEHEAPVIMRIQAALTDQNIAAQVWVGNDTTLETLLGLISFSRVYLGNDTGPMHFAAALDKPVIAIFGGGHWPRFVPAAEEGAVVVQELPCFGCGWQCVFKRTLCINEVKEEWVINAVVEFEGNKLRPMTIFSNSFDGEVMNRWIAEAKEQLTTYRTEVASANALREEHTLELQELHHEAKLLREGLSALSEKEEGRLAQLSTLQSELDQVRIEKHAFEKHIKQLEQFLEEGRRQSAFLKNEVSERENMLERFRIRAEDEARVLATLGGELETARAENTRLAREVQRKNDGLRSASRTIIDLRPKLEELHLAIRQQDQVTQKFENYLIGAAQSGWIRLGIRIGIPWLSRWYRMVFRQDSPKHKPVVVKEEFENPLSVKDQLMNSIKEASTLLESVR